MWKREKREEPAGTVSILKKIVMQRVLENALATMLKLKEAAITSKNNNL